MKAENSGTESSNGPFGHRTVVEMVEGFGVEMCVECGEVAHVGRMSNECPVAVENERALAEAESEELARVERLAARQGELR